MNPAPLAIFVYDRPRHLSRTLESLRKCRSVELTPIFVFCDGYVTGEPKTNNEKDIIEKITETRRIARAIDFGKSLEVIERNRNFGVRDSIISGVESVLSEFEAAIFLEDDVEVSPGFLEYMNDALALYADEPRVTTISAFLPPVEKELPETFFLRTISSSGGWATWRDSWRYESDSNKLRDEIDRLDLADEFNLHGNSDFLFQLDANRSGLMRTWAINRYATVFLEGGLCLFPGKSLTRNFGFDASGSHSPKTGKYEIRTLPDKIDVRSILIEESRIGLEALEYFYSSISNCALKSYFYKRYSKSAFARTLFNIYYRINRIGK